MSGLRLLCDDGADLPVSFAKCISAAKGNFLQDEDTPFCEMLSQSVLTGILDPTRKHLVPPCGPTAKLVDQPEIVQAVVCRVTSESQPSFVALLSKAGGPIFILPRNGALSPSRVHIRVPDDDDVVVAVARGADPYGVLLDAGKVLGHATGMSARDAHAYVLPLLDSACRLRFDSSLTSAKSIGAKGPAGTSVMYEQHLQEGIFVQAGPDCPAKPLLQAPSLRTCPGMPSSMGLRYSGMSVVYGAATGHVLAVMDTAAALKMAPASVIRASTPGNILTSRSSGVGCGSDSPFAVSAAASDTTSATPSPSISRANSCGGNAVDMPSLDASASVGTAALQQSVSGGSPPPLVQVLSGRSITAAPIIHVLAAEPWQSQRQFSSSAMSTPTGVPVNVLASFALVGLRTAAGRDSNVRCCRIMPSSSLLAAAGNETREALLVSGVAGAAGPEASGLGLVVQVEVKSSAAATLLVFVEGSEAERCTNPEGSDDDEEEPRPVQAVMIDGQPARWRYDATGGMLFVDVPASAGPRAVQVFL